MTVSKQVNLAQMTSTTTGTGDALLVAASSAYLTFAQAGLLNGDIVTYAIRDGANAEIGQGVYYTSGPTLARTSVRRSTNSGSKINLSGTAIIYVTVAAEDNKLVNLADINVVPGAPVDGQFLKWDQASGKFTLGIPIAGGLTTTTTNAYRYYRISLARLAGGGGGGGINGGGLSFGMKTISFRTLSTDADGSMPARTILSDPSGGGANWFDENDSTNAVISTSTAVVVLDFATPQIFRKLVMKSIDSYSNKAFDDVLIEGSVDNASYVAVQHVSGLAFPNDASSVTLNITLTPSVTTSTGFGLEGNPTGHAGDYLKVADDELGFNFIKPSRNVRIVNPNLPAWSAFNGGSGALPAYRQDGIDGTALFPSLSTGPGNSAFGYRRSIAARGTLTGGNKFEAIVRLELSTPEDLGNPGIGLVLFSSDIFVGYFLGVDSSVSSKKLLQGNLGNPAGSIHTRPGSGYLATWLIPKWFRLVCDGTTIYFYEGQNGRDWASTYALDVVTEIGAAPTSVGLMMLTFGGNDAADGVTPEFAAYTTYYADSLENTAFL